ncbi:hypothetical protein HSE3_gp129 [Bacillus phage vB_BceM-HSE3]|nr:hypothetical protein HSE3_gp129 [Bacillus phage vB_BceM-HSE3]
MDRYHVVIKSYKDKKYREQITSEPKPERLATKLERGVNINLNHDEYYTELEFVE